jgi:membrane protease YdiL (CAAX protease family)
MGLFYSALLYVSGSLRLPIFAHALHNLVIIALFGRLNLG